MGPAIVELVDRTESNIVMMDNDLEIKTVLRMPGSALIQMSAQFFLLYLCLSRLLDQNPYTACLRMLARSS